ncbi:MAG: PKD domain-containing protein [Methylacidiphilales bacterium]|nr:PKD domain-containing protein [Candidatus Methylacidiphilales bacterium]MDW8350216.1 PKD domain-containing protein [Verrucomicrobiae bacterium]
MLTRRIALAIASLISYLTILIDHSAASNVIFLLDTPAIYHLLSKSSKTTNPPQTPRPLEISLAKYIQSLPKNTRLRIIGHDDKIFHDEEFIFSEPKAASAAQRTIRNILNRKPSSRQGNLTSTLAKSLQHATNYSLSTPNEITHIYIYTANPEPTEPFPDLDTTLKQYPLLNGKNICAHIFFIGPSKFSLPIHEGLESSQHPDMKDLTPPLITWKPTTPTTGANITFTEATQHPFRSYRWLINDLPAGDQRTIQRLFNQPGLYTATLIVDTESGQEILTKENIQVAIGTLEVSFTHSPPRIQRGQPVTFTPQSNSPLKEITWLINNTPISNANELRTKFDTLGEHQITIQAKDEHGNTTTHTQTITVEEHYIQPQAQLHIPTTTGTAPLTLTFGATITGDFSKLTWDLGDGRTSTETFTEHTYRHPGTYHYKLTIIPEDPTHQKVELTGTITVKRDWSWLLIPFPILLTLLIPLFLTLGFSPPIDGILSGKKTIDLAKYKRKSKLTIPLSAVESEADGYITFHFKGKKYAPRATATLTHVLCNVNGRRFLPGEPFPLRRRTTIQLANRETLIYSNSRLDYDVA